MPYVTHTSATRHAVAVAVAAIALLCLLALPDAADAALQKIAGYERGDDNRFASLYGYFANLRDAILPLSIPIGTIGMVVGGTMYMFGNHNAGRLLFGVVVGLGLILLAPSIVA